MQCVILAAGVGKRMRPFTEDIPKPMIPLLNKPVIEHIIRKIKYAGIRDIKIVVGYKQEQIREHFGDGSSFRVDIEYIEQPFQTGTGAALLTSMERVDDEILVIQGDSLVGTKDLIHIGELKPPVVGIYPSNTPDKYGVIDIAGNTVTKLEEKPNIDGKQWVNTGVYHFNTLEIFDELARIDKSPRGEYELTDALKPLIRVCKLKAYQMEHWRDISTPWDLLNVTEEMVGNGPRIGKNVEIDPTAYVEKTVILGDGTKIWRNAIIRGNTVIGKNCYIGHCSEVKNSIIMDNTRIPHFNYVGDSIIGSGCNLGAGTKVANLRNDGKNIRINGEDTGRKKLGVIMGNNVKTGINCSINCGSVIASGMHIPPHTFVRN